MMSIASSRRSARSVRQSLASSTAARSRLPRYCSSLASKRENSANESAADPAKPARMLSLYRRRIFRAPCLTIVCAERHLAIAGQHGLVLVPHGEDRRRMDHLSEAICWFEGVSRNADRGWPRARGRCSRAFDAVTSAKHW